MAPEVLNHKKYDSKVDLWSIGIILYELLSGHRPYHATSLIELINIITEPLEYPKKIFSNSIKSLISGLLELNPEKRFDIQKVLLNEYVKKNCSNKLIETYCQEDLNNFESTYSIIIIEDALEIKSLKSILNSNLNLNFFDVSFPRVIFNFENLKSNSEELIIIEAIEENLKRSWIISELAFIKSKMNKNQESFCLYLKSIELLYTSYISIKGKYKSKRINASKIKKRKKLIFFLIYEKVKYWIQQRYDEFLNYSKEIQLLIEKEKKKEKILCENLIFTYSINLMKLASYDEYLEKEKEENYKLLYERSLILINYLNTLKIDQKDQIILKKCKKCSIVLNLFSSSFFSFKDYRKKLR